MPAKTPFSAVKRAMLGSLIAIPASMYYAALRQGIKAAAFDLAQLLLENNVTPREKVRRLFDTAVFRQLFGGY